MMILLKLRLFVGPTMKLISHKKSLKFHAGVQKLKPFTCTDCEANFSTLPR
jgi:hypothetical protein